MNVLHCITPFFHRHSRAIVAAVVLALYALYLCAPSGAKGYKGLSSSSSSASAGPPMLQRPPSLYGFPDAANLAPTGVQATIQSDFSAYGLSRCVPQPFIPSLRVLAEAETPRRRPPHVQRVLDEIQAVGLEAYTRKKPLDGINSTPLSDEDVARAEAHWIEALPPAPMGHDPRTACGGGGAKAAFHGQTAADLERRALSQLVYNQLRHSVQRRLIDATPMVLDVGCVVGETYARHNPRATVLCLHFSRRFSTKPSHADVPPNLFHLFPPAEIAEAANGAVSLEALLDEQFRPFFQMCNFFTLVFVLGNLREDLARPAAELVPLLERLLPMSALLYAAVPGADEGAFAAAHFVSPPLRPLSHEEKEAERLQAVEALVRKGEAERRQQRDREAAAAKLPPAPTRIENLTVANVGIAVASRLPSSIHSAAGASSPSSSPLARSVVIKAYALGGSSRPCRKTWNAPFVQWDRSQSVAFDEGRVSFVVRRAPKPGSAGEGGDAPDPQRATETLRNIHPLQYLASINLDTLLGAGLSEPARIRLLGDMIATPRYSDPLPHNWVVTEGRAVRIDKVDLAYDAKVDEKKGYWGRSTRGYLRLLTEHLCLPPSADGSPSPFLRLDDDTVPDGSGEACVEVCRNCIDLCSYLPKGSMCRDCARCGGCVRGLGLRLQGAVIEHDPEGFAKVQTCQKTYSSMHAAVKQWAKWERSDNAALARAA